MDIVINYAVLCCSVVGLIAAHSGTTSGVLRSLGLLLWFTIFQVLLCLGVGCAGISVIWCAAVAASTPAASRLGWMNTGTKPRPVSQENIFGWGISTLKGVLAASAATTSMAIVYYAVVAEAITTLAHVLALGLGYLSDVAVSRAASRCC